MFHPDSYGNRPKRSALHWVVLYVQRVNGRLWGVWTGRCLREPSRLSLLSR